MTTRLKSYLEARWVEGSGNHRPLFNPTTEELLAETSTQGLDFGAAVEFARTRGGKALRELTFARRGELLGAMAKAIHEYRDELIELATTNGGNTRGDAKFDIDGCTGTMAYYASLAKTIGERSFLMDGEMEQLARAPRFVGQHIRVPRQGVAFHINAFNFPGWGFGEKAATSLLAGMPVITKPATSSALVASRMVQIIIDAGVLPDGALSMVCGSSGDLLDHVTGQDVIAFTGSSDTGARIRGAQRAVASNVRVNVEADSLNAAVLAPDVDRDGDTYDLFLREVARDMTQKAGQKCTAIRRIFVPADRVETVSEDLSESVKAVRVGNPTLREVRMGPLATADQLEDIRAGVERLKACARPVLGDGGRGELVDVQDGKGYFMAPVLFVADDAREAADVHAHEVFGPVATILPYSGDAAEASELLNLGAGGLVSSIYSDKAVFVREIVLGSAPFLGRIHIGSARIAEHSPGPGTVLPHMVHGGPGRAGGGEELGGLRGLNFYLQRTALQGSKPLLEKILA